MKIREAKNAKAVIVIVHGAFEHSGQVMLGSCAIVSHDYHVVLWSLPGHAENIPQNEAIFVHFNNTSTR